MANRWAYDHREYLRRAAAIRRFVAEYAQTNGYAPTVREISDHIEISRSRTHQAIQDMIDDGLLIGTPRMARTIRVTEAVMPEIGETV